MMTDSEYAKVIAKNLREIMYKHNKTQADVAKDLKISKATLSTWMNGTRIPRMNKIDLLCHYFNVTRADLMEPKEDRPEKETMDYTELFDQELLAAYHAAPESMKDAVCVLLGIQQKHGSFGSKAG